MPLHLGLSKNVVSVAADGSEDDEINLNGLEQYEKPEVEDFQFDEEDPFASLSEDADNSSTCSELEKSSEED